MKHLPFIYRTRKPEPKRITPFLLLCLALVGFWVWNSVVIPERESKARSEEIKAEIDRTLALPYSEPQTSTFTF